MPKSRTILPNKQKLSNRTKFKMGGRKSNKSALDMSNEELEKVVADPSAGRLRPKAASALARRGAK